MAPFLHKFARLMLTGLFAASLLMPVAYAQAPVAADSTEADMHVQMARPKPPVKGDLPIEATSPEPISAMPVNPAEKLPGLHPVTAKTPSAKTPSAKTPSAKTPSDVKRAATGKATNATVPPPPSKITPPNPEANITPDAAAAKRTSSALRESPEADESPNPANALSSHAPIPHHNSHSSATAAESAESSIRTPWIAIVYELDKTDVNNAFISNALNGAHQAHEELRTPFVETRITSAADREKTLSDAAQKYKLVIAIGYQLVPTIITLAEKYPDTHFTLIDGMVPPLFSNVQSIMFKDHEGAFLVGMLAAYSTRSKNVGFVGGMDVPVIRNFAVGFQQGVHFVDPTVQIQNGMVGSPALVTDAWNNPDRAEKLARDMYKAGADVIFAAAGSSGVGVLRAAKAMDRLAIGVDSNQNYLFPGTVLTSMVKRVDRAVYDTIRASKEGDWQPGIKYLGIKEEALDFSVDRNNRALINQQMLDSLENAKDMIIRGSKVVESYQP